MRRGCRLTFFSYVKETKQAVGVGVRDIYWCKINRQCSEVEERKTQTTEITVK